MGHIRSDDVVASALRDSDAGMPDAQNAAKHDVAVKTIRRRRREYQLRGRPRGQTHLHALCPRCDDANLDRPAYSELLGWYLGDGHISLGRRDVYNLHIINDAKYIGLNAGIIELMRKVKPGSRPHSRNTPGAVITTVGWKHWPCLIPQLGSGRKHERSLVLEPWQREIVEEHPAAFLRGLFHSDGSRVNNWATRVVSGENKRYDYPRWQFVNNSADIRGFCTDALDLLDIPWRQSNWKTVSVSTREGVAMLNALVGLKS
jgi:hypothetical protein